MEAPLFKRKYTKTVIDEWPIEKVRESSATCRAFEEQFGTENTLAMLRCGAYRHERPRTDDYFMDCVNVAIGYTCLTAYYDHNGFTGDPEAVREWVIEHFPLDQYSDDKSMFLSMKKTYKEYLRLG